MRVRVLLADDTAIIRKAILSLLGDEKQIEVVGEAEDFAQTLTLTRQLKPHVVILDLHMPGSRLTPMALSDELRSQNASVIAISVYCDEETKALAQTYGADTLLDKMKLGEELIPSILKITSQPPQNRFVSSYGGFIRSHGS
jgi:DNA-binding NarL/FixJ family response regulator